MEKKMKLVPIEMFEYGGFFSDVIIEGLEEIYCDDTLDVIFENNCIGKNLYEICDAIENAVQKRKKRDRRVIFTDCVEVEEEVRNKNDEAFYSWYYKQIIKCTRERIENVEPHFWENYKISYSQRKKLDEISAVAEGIYKCMCGEVDGLKYSIDEVAKLSEYNCPVEWIERVIFDMDKVTLAPEEIADIFQISFEHE